MAWLPLESNPEVMNKMPDSRDWTQYESDVSASNMTHEGEMNQATDELLNQEEQEEENEEDRNYRLKIEDQKRLREAVIREKEERRLRRLAEKEPVTVSEAQSNGTCSLQGNAIATIVNRQPSITGPARPESMSRSPIQAQQPTRPANQVRVAPIVQETSGVNLKVQTEDLPKTKFVSISNLSASTTEADINNMCLTVGTVEKIEMVPAERKAMIVFTNPISGPLFFAKYNRKMIDLSLVDVCLHL